MLRAGVCRALAIMGCFVALDSPRREECPRVKVDNNIPKERRRGRDEDGDDTAHRLAWEGFQLVQRQALSTGSDSGVVERGLPRSMQVAVRKMQLARSFLVADPEARMRFFSEA